MMANIVLILLNFSKKYWHILVLILFGFLIYTLTKSVFELKQELEQSKTNLIEIQNENSNLVFKNGELKDFLKVQNSKEKRIIDSIARAYNIKLKQIKQAQVAHISYVDTTFHVIDSTFITYKEVEILKDSSYVIPFAVNKDCYNINGEIFSRDSCSTIGLNRVEFMDDIVRIKYKKKKWYEFWKWFCKPKPEYITIGRCSNVEFKNFEEED